MVDKDHTADIKNILSTDISRNLKSFVLILNTGNE